MMLIPKTDKWVLVRWHGGVRSVERAKYLQKFLPPGEDLKISTVIKIDGGKDGKTEKATVLISGNERHQLELLSEPGERNTCSDDECLDAVLSLSSGSDRSDKTHEVVEKVEDVEKDKAVEKHADVEEVEDVENDEDFEKDEDVENDEEVEFDEFEDYEGSSSDWTPASSDLDYSSEESPSVDEDKNASKKNKSSSKSSMNLQCNKKRKERLSPNYRRSKQIMKKTMEKLTRLYIETDREMALIEERNKEEEQMKNLGKQDNSSETNKNYREKSEEKMANLEKKRKESKESKKKNKNRSDLSKQRKNEDDQSIDELILYMHTMFAGLFKALGNEYSDIDCPAEYKNVKVNVYETGDIVIADKNYYKKMKKLNKQKAEYHKKTLTPHDSDNEPLSTIGKNNNKASITNSRNTEPCKDNDTQELCEDTNITESCKEKKTPSCKEKKIKEPCKTPLPCKDGKTTGRCKNKEAPEACMDNVIPEPCKEKKTKETCKDKKTKEPFMEKLQSLDNKISTPVANEKLVEARADDAYNNCDYSSDRSDDPVLISNKYETVETNNERELEWIPIGSGTTLIHKDKFAQVTWKSYTKATRSLLLAAFTRKTLATHSLTGKKSPAFLHKRAKMCLDPKIVSDIVIEVADRFHIRDNLVRNIITTKCADEAKMLKLRKANKALKRAKVVKEVNNTKDIENNDQERVPTPEETSKTGKKKTRKPKSPKRVYNKKKTGVNPRKKIQETITSPQKHSDENIPPKNQEDISTIDYNTKNVGSKNEEIILTSDDEGNMVIDEDYVPPVEINALKSIENKDQEFIQQSKNTRMSIDNIEKHNSSKNEDQENAPVLPQDQSQDQTQDRNNKKIDNKNQENIPPPVKKGIKGFKTYKNKSKLK